MPRLLPTSTCGGVSHQTGGSSPPPSSRPVNLGGHRHHHYVLLHIDRVTPVSELHVDGTDLTTATAGKSTSSTTFPASVDVAVQLNGRRAHVIATDPEAIPNYIRLQPQLGFATDTADAPYGADCVVPVIERQECRDLDPAPLRAHVRTPLVIDGCNVLDPAVCCAAGSIRAVGVRCGQPVAGRCDPSDRWVAGRGGSGECAHTPVDASSAARQHQAAPRRARLRRVGVSRLAGGERLHDEGQGEGWGGGT